MIISIIFLLLVLRLYVLHQERLISLVVPFICYRSVKQNLFRSGAVKMPLYNTVNLKEPLSVAELREGQFVIKDEDVQFHDVPDNLRCFDSGYDVEEYKGLLITL